MPRVPAARIFLAASLLLGGEATAQVVFNVDDTADDIDANVLDGKCETPLPAKSCTLRAAIMQSNRIPAAGTTIVLPAGTYKLTVPATLADGEENGDLNVYVPSGYAPGPTSIVGSGSEISSIDAMGQSRVLNVARTLAITGVSIINGHVTSSSGGGIVNSGQLTLTDCMISNNTATYLAVGGRGGGIFNSGLLSLTRVSVTSNFASELGGGIYSSGFLTMTQSVLAGNPGGGLYNETSGNASIERTTITGNSGYLGGGISNGGTLFISNSTLAENSAKKDGGAIFSNNSAKIYNTTIAYNEADSDADGVGDGAGIFNASGSTFNIRNSVIAGNYLAGQQDYQDCFGTFGIFGNNQLSDGSGCLAGVGSPGTATLIGSVYELGILNDNGGPTRTVALIAPSSLIGGAVGCVDQNNVQLATDQRGRSRPPTGNRCDIGAYEYNDIFANGF